MARLQEARSGTRPQVADPSHPLRWPQSVRRARDGSARLHLQVGWALVVPPRRSGLQLLEQPGIGGGEGHLVQVGRLNPTEGRAANGARLMLAPEAAEEP